MKKTKKSAPRWVYIERGALVLLLILVTVVGAIYYLRRKPQLVQNQQQKLNEEVANQGRLQSILLSERQKVPLHLPILVYHYVEVVTDTRDTIRKSLSILPTTFDEQVKTLLDNGFTPITLDTLSSYYQGAPNFPTKPVILSFDDGYRDFYTDVLPILRKYRVHAVLYMVSRFLDLNKNYLTSAQLHEIDQSGLVEVDAHSVNHANLRSLSQAAAVYEIAQSKKDLEIFLGHPVHHFAYPYGAYTDQIANWVAQAGFWTGATTDSGVTQMYVNRYKLLRLHPGSNTGTALLSRLGYN